MFTNFLISMPGGGEWILILIVALLLFGGKKIPELMRGLGRGIREFNDAKDQVKTHIEDGVNETDPRKAPQSAPVQSAPIQPTTLQP